MPVSGTCCGLSGALSAIVREPNRGPTDVGVNVTVIVQLAPALTLLPQLLVVAKSPEAAIFETASATAPVLVRVTVCDALVLPTVCGPNNRKAGETAAGLRPIPRSGICRGLSGAPSAIVSAPIRGPAAVGVKVTAIVQLAPVVTLLPQLLVAAKSPEAAIFETASATVPVLVKVTVCGALVLPTVCGSNNRKGGETLSAGPIPVPVSET